MQWYSMLAIYFLFWFVCLFVVLPFGVKTHDELGIDKVPGQADSAPGNFQPRRVVIGTTLLSAAVFALFYLNWINGWLGRAELELLAS